MASALDTTIKRWLRGLLGVHNDSTDDVEGMVKRAYRQSFCITTSNDGSASTNIDPLYFYEAQNNQSVTAASVHGANVAGNSTDYVTFNLLKANGGGGTATVLATNAADRVVKIPLALTLNTTAGSCDLNTGEVLAYQILKGGSTGIACGITQYSVEVEER